MNKTNNKKLETLVNRSCVSNDKRFFHQDASTIPKNVLDKKLVSFVNWPTTSLNYRSDEFSNISIFYFREDKNYTKFQFLSNNSHSFVSNNFNQQPNGKYDHFIVFKFNSYYKYMSCGKPCYLDSKLNWISVDYMEPRLKIRETVCLPHFSYSIE